MSGSVEASTITQSLAELTAGWAPAPGVEPTTLNAARLALARTLAVTPRSLALRSAPVVDASAAPSPELAAQLRQIATEAHAAHATDTVAVVRTPSPVDASNLTGVPAWAQGGLVVDSYGPFIDALGISHWVDLLPITTSDQVQFAGAAPFALVPVVTDIFRVPLETGKLAQIPSIHVGPPPNELRLGSGSVWFLASLLGTGFPTGEFTGFTISGGTLIGTEAFTSASGVYTAPAGTTLTLTATLSPPAPATGTAVSPDAAAAVATPPIQIVITFTSTSATLESVGPAQVKAYGTSLTLTWDGEAPTSNTDLSGVLIACTQSAPEFDFATSASAVFTPSGTAPITAAAWVFPLAKTAIAHLPEAATSGSAWLTLDAGGQVVTEVEPVTVDVAGWLLEIGTGMLMVKADVGGSVASTTLTLWPEAPPSTLSATVNFATDDDSAFVLFATPKQEMLVASGTIAAHLDHPLDAAGRRIPFSAPEAGLVLLHNPTGRAAFVVAEFPGVDHLPELTLSLENALLGLSAPNMFIAGGPISGTAFQSANATFTFELEWLLPTLPDPYASTFDISELGDRDRDPSPETVATLITWDGTDPPAMSCAVLSASGAVPTLGALSPRTQTETAVATEDVLRSGDTVLALLDLSTRVDLFGVALTPELARTTDAGAAAGRAPSFGLVGMALAVNGAEVATFAVPQVSREAVETVAGPGGSGPIFSPASDGPPLLLVAPEDQQLVPCTPAAVLTNNIQNVATGTPFRAQFSLPFGLSGLIEQPNNPGNLPDDPSEFLADGGTFASPAVDFQPSTSSGPLSAAVSLTLEPTRNSGISGSSPCFPGWTYTERASGVQATSAETLQYVQDILSLSVETTFAADFGPEGAQGCVPLERIDFSGYGASIFSEYLNEDEPPPAIIKVQFEASRGRTLYEVVQARSVIYPYGINVVRTITLERQNAGWISRTDSGWQTAGPGLLSFPAGAQPYAGAVHKGALVGAYNVRNVAEHGDQKVLDGLTFQQVVFDADLAVAANLTVPAGAFKAQPQGASGPLTLVPSRGVVGYVQLAPVGQPAMAPQLADLITTYGPFTANVAFTAEAGRFGGGSGTVLRAAAFEIDVVSTGQAAVANPAIGVALRGAPQIPRGGGWSMGVRSYRNQAPTALPNDFPVPLVQNNASADLWHIADVADLGSLTQPANYYNLMHATGTNKVLFEAPQIPVSAAGSTGTGVPGLQFPKLPAALPLGVTNPGSPNLGDLASILNSTGLFPQLSSALSLLTQNELPQIKTIPEGFQYSKTYTFPPDASGKPASTTIVDLGIININLVYADTTQDPAVPAELVYSVDSTASPSWTLSLETLSLQVTVPAFGSSPVLTITGGFYGDEHTKPGLTNLNVSLGSALSVIKSVFSDLQTLAAFLPGGVGADLDVAVSDGLLTVSDTFTIGDLPLGLGQLTDISLDLGLEVNLSPMSVDFLVGLGAPQNPFNWIASPLAGNGLMNFGVQDSLPAFIIQAGIGLGLSIDLGIAEGSASITIAVELDVSTDSIELIATLTGQASVDVLDGLASASITLSAGIGFSITPLPIPEISGDTITIPSCEIDLIATCSVGIHITICWVVSIGWDGSWEFKEGFPTPQLSATL